MLVRVKNLFWILNRKSSHSLSFFMCASPLGAFEFLNLQLQVCFLVANWMLLLLGRSRVKSMNKPRNKLGHKRNFIQKISFIKYLC